MASMACVPLIRLMPSLGCSSIGSMPARRRASPPGSDCALEFGLAFADQHQRHVRQRRQVARSAHAALRRHHRRDAAVQQIAKAFGHQRADAGEALGQHVGADQHHGAHHFARQRLAHAGRVRADHVALQLLQIARAECARRPAGRRPYSPRRWVHRRPPGGRSRRASAACARRRPARAPRRRCAARATAQTSAMVRVVPSRGS